jgi:CRP-like cAMP-binding protein
MKDFLGILQKVELFREIDAAELETMLDCLGVEIKSAKKGRIILLQGDKSLHVGIVLAGRIHITREDYDGNSSFIEAVEPGEIFAEALCCADVPESPVTATADAASTIMLMSFSRILHTCKNSCPFHTRLIGNMLSLIAKKNILLQRRMEIICLKSIRARVMRYLEALAPKRGQEFAIPLDRGEMAGYLCVDRSALSHELRKMKRDGLIEYRKNKFLLT